MSYSCTCWLNSKRGKLENSLYPWELITGCIFSVYRYDGPIPGGLISRGLMSGDLTSDNFRYIFCRAQKTEETLATRVILVPRATILLTSSPAAGIETCRRSVGSWLRRRRMDESTRVPTRVGTSNVDCKFKMADHASNTGTFWFTDFSAIPSCLPVWFMDGMVVNAIPMWSYTPLKRTFPSEHPFFQVRKFIVQSYMYWERDRH